MMFEFPTPLIAAYAGCGWLQAKISRDRLLVNSQMLDKRQQPNLGQTATRGGESLGRRRLME
jgi:hypothetical protein